MLFSFLIIFFFSKTYQRDCYTCSYGLRAAKLSPETKEYTKQKPRNLHCTRPAEPIPSIRNAGSGITCCSPCLFILQ